MSLYENDPLYQELLSKGYKPGFNPNTEETVFYMLNVTGNAIDIKLTKPAELHTLLDGENNNPTEQIKELDGNTRYSVTLSPNKQPALTDRIAVGPSSTPQEDFCYGIDLSYSDEFPSFRALILGYDTEQQYTEATTYMLAMCGLFLELGGIPNNDGGYFDAAKIYNLDPTQSKSFQLKSILPQALPLTSYDTIAVEIFGNETLTQQSQAYSFDLAAQTNPLRSHISVESGSIADKRWNMGVDGEFDGWTFGLAYSIGDDPTIYSATVNLNYADLVNGSAQILTALLDQITQSFGSEVSRVFQHPNIDDWKFRTGAEFSEDGCFFWFEGNVENDSAPELNGFSKVIIYPNYDFQDSHNVINVGRDYTVDARTNGVVEHIPYPVYTLSQNGLRIEE